MHEIHSQPSSRIHTLPSTSPSSRLELSPSDIDLAADFGLEIDELTRQQYIAKLKNIRESQGDADLSMRRDLRPTSQSLLQQLVVVESISSDFGNKSLGRHMGLLDKAPFSQAIGETVGHRPQSITFSLNEYPTVVSDLDTLLDSGAVYIKANNGFRGENVTRVEKTDRGMLAVSSKGRRLILDSLTDYRPQPGYLTNSDVFIAEQEIPIAPTGSGGTWEVRMLPPFSDEYFYAKVDDSGKGVNNISQGGERKSAPSVIEGVIRAKYPTANENEVAQKTADFIDGAKGLAATVKQLSDKIQLALAKSIIKPDDLKDPTLYDEVMGQCFAGNFLAVDITGVWDDEGSLIPMVIEAQTSAALADSVAGRAYHECLEQMNAKIRALKAALR